METSYGQQIIGKFTLELVFEDLMDRIFDYLIYCNTFSYLFVKSELEKSAVSPLIASYVKQAHEEFEEYLPEIKQTSAFKDESFPYLTHKKLKHL